MGMNREANQYIPRQPFYQVCDDIYQVYDDIGTLVPMGACYLLLISYYVENI